MKRDPIVQLGDIGIRKEDLIGLRDDLVKSRERLLWVSLVRVARSIVAVYFSVLNSSVSFGFSLDEVT